MRKMLFLITIYLFSFLSIRASYIVLSASVSGKFIILNNTKNGNKIVIDVKSKRVLKYLDSSFIPLSWIGDSSIIFSKDEIGMTNIGSYDINSGKITLLDSINNDQGWRDAIDANLVSFPTHINSWSNLFFIYLRENEIYKFGFDNHSFDKIFTVIKEDNENINNISVDSKGDKIVISLRNNNSSRYILACLNRHTSQSINKSYFSNSSGNFSYFLNDNRISLFNVKNTSVGITTDIEVYNIEDNSTTKITSINNARLINPIALRGYKKILINTFDPSPVSINLKNKKGNIIKELIKYISESLSSIQIDYSYVD